MGFSQQYDVRAVIPKAGDGDFLAFNLALLNAVRMAYMTDQDYAANQLLKCNLFGGELASLDSAALLRIAESNVTLVALDLSEEACRYLDGSNDELAPAVRSKLAAVQAAVNAQVMELIIRITELYLKSHAAVIITYGVTVRNAKLLAAASFAKRKELVIKGHISLRPRVNANWLTRWPESLPVELLLQ